MIEVLGWAWVLFACFPLACLALAALAIGLGYPLLWALRAIDKVLP